MRRKDREVTDINEIVAIIKKCDVCRVAFADGGVSYIVPMNFGISFTDGNITLYFHGAGEGRKHEILKNNPIVCFEFDCSHRLIKGTEASNYTMEYESVIGTGTISYCNERNEKVKALTYLMKQYEPQKDFSFPDNVTEAVTVLRLEVNEITGKKLSV